MTTANKNSPKRTRTVKISDDHHYRIRVLSVEQRKSMQDLLEDVLEQGLKAKKFRRLIAAEVIA